MMDEYPFITITLLSFFLFVYMRIFLPFSIHLEIFLLSSSYFLSWYRMPTGSLNHMCSVIIEVVGHKHDDFSVAYLVSESTTLANISTVPIEKGLHPKSYLSSQRENGQG